MPKRLEAKISGKVQGINFRNFVEKHAYALKLQGWVRNDPDGSVTVLAEGEPEALREFEKVLWKGPLFAKVRDVQVQYGEPTGEFQHFSRLQ